MESLSQSEAGSRPETVENRLRLVIDTIPCLIMSAKPDGPFDFVNRWWLEFTGFKLEEVQGWRWRTALHSEDAGRVVKEWRAGLASGEPFETEARVRRVDGKYRWFLLRNVPLRDEERRIVQWYGTGHDTEDLKQAANSLRLAIDATPALLHTCRPDGYLDYFNHRWVEYLGLPLEEICGWRWTSAIHPDDVEKMVKNWRSSLATGEPFEAEVRVRRADGEYRWQFHRKVPLLDQSGAIVKWYGSSIDIEDRKRSEDALRRSEKELRQLIDVIPQQVFVFDSEWEPQFANRRGLEYTGLTLEEAQSRDTIARIFYPEDLEKLEVLRRRALSDGSPFEMEARIRGKDGQHRWFLIRDNPLRDEAGRVVRWYGTHTDIEDRKRAEDALRKSEKELRQLIDVIPQQVFVFDSEWEPQFANRRELEYTGLTLKEAQTGDTIARLFHPEDLKKLEFLRRRALSDGFPFEMEARIRGNDGQYRWFLIRDNPLRDEEGRVVRWYGTRTDIEDRKRAEGSLQQALEEIKTLRDQLYKENIALREEIEKTSMFEEIVGASPALKSVLGGVAKVAPTDSTVLITGETGTGKELIARAIHKRSKRSARAFVSVNCAAIPRDLIASELFGHEKGAFTGATQRRLGRFELAEGGTIFLDEIGELPAETQIALLRVLQEREFERVGGNLPIRAEVRVIAATNRDLEAAIAAGTFRSDLFYRLNVFPVEIPALRERRDDIPLLVEYFIDRYARKAGKSIRRINKRSQELLQAYPWPGNIRELQNIIERSVIVCETENLSIDESWLSRHPHVTNSINQPELLQKLAAQEKEMIEAALKECGGRVFGPLTTTASYASIRATK
jgi:PAS domain S-box-containing protein